MSTPPTLKDLCERVGLTKWTATSGTVRVDSPKNYERIKICAVPSPIGAAPEAWSHIHNMRADTAQLIARCSPEVMARVYEALESASKLNTSQTCPDENHNVVVLAMDALALLDGKEEAK